MGTPVSRVGACTKAKVTARRLSMVTLKAALCILTILDHNMGIQDRRVIVRSTDT